MSSLDEVSDSDSARGELENVFEVGSLTYTPRLLLVVFFWLLEIIWIILGHSHL